jgi:hypothetical protein
MFPESEILMRWCSPLTALFSAAFLYYMLGRGSHLYRHIPQLFNGHFMIFTTSLHTFNVLIQLGNVVGLFGSKQSAIFTFGVLWLLFHSMLQLGRILFVQPAGLHADHAADSAAEVAAP